MSSGYFGPEDPGPRWIGVVEGVLLYGGIIATLVVLPIVVVLSKLLGG